MDEHAGVTRGVRAARHRAAASCCGCRPSSPPSTARTPACGSRCATAPRARCSRRCAAARADLGAARARRRGRAGRASTAAAAARRAAAADRRAGRGARRVVPIAELSLRPLILAERGTALRETVMAACQAGGLQPRAAVRGRRPGDGALPRARGARRERRARPPGSSAPGRRCRSRGWTRAAAAAVPARARRRAHARRPAAARAAAARRSPRAGRPGRRPGASSGATPTICPIGRAVAEDHEGRHRQDAVAGRRPPGWRRRRP